MMKKSSLRIFYFCLESRKTVPKIHATPMLSGIPNSTFKSNTDNTTEDSGSTEASAPTSEGLMYFVLSR